MANLLQGSVWLADHTGKRCTDVRTEPLGWAITRRRDSEFHPLLGNTSYDVEVTHLCTLGEISFDVPMGVRATHVMVQVGDHKISVKLKPRQVNSPSPGVVNVGPLDFEVKERQG